MISIDSISFSYGNDNVVNDVSFDIANGMHVSVIGESGSGKSTLLKLLFGMYDLVSGSITYGGTPILGPKFNLLPGPPGFGYLAQDFGLMPYLSSAENVGKFLSNTDKPKKKARIAELLELVEMSEYSKIDVKNLSGGQQQRIAITKALAPRPEVLLLDEPFSQIDVFRRNTLRRNVYGFLKEAGVTCITATHDSDEVLAFSDLVIVMRNGKVVASGRPKEIYHNPPSRYVATLFGDVSEIPKHLLNGGVDDGEMVLCYPQMLRAVEVSPLRAVVVNSYFKGNYYLISTTSNCGTIYFISGVPFESGTGVYLGYRKASII